MQTEVAFWPFYENQPSFADQDRALQALGLQFFAMQSVNRFPLAGVPQRLRRQSRRRDAGPWVDGDALYVRQIAQWPGLSTLSGRFAAGARGFGRGRGAARARYRGGGGAMGPGAA
ncbi:MAG: hypothetical protein ACO3VR_07365 [Lutimaribacter sp.]